MTVYAQARLNGQVLSPAQVGPGECTLHITGDSVGYHPNAVYLNGSGEELMEADGTGSWWVKHAWILGGEGYYNWPLLLLEKEYGEGQWAEGILLEDGLTMKIESQGGGFNLRKPILDVDPIEIQINFGEGTPAAQIINMECRTEISAFDGLGRSCPILIE